MTPLTIYANMRFMILDSKALGAAIGKALKERGTSQNEASTALALDQSRISRLVNGHFKRDTKNLRNVCVYANIRYENYIINEKVDPKLLHDAVIQLTRGDKKKVMALLRIIKVLEALKD